MNRGTIVTTKCAARLFPEHRNAHPAAAHALLVRHAECAAITARRTKTATSRQAPQKRRQTAAPVNIEVPDEVLNQLAELAGLHVVEIGLWGKAREGFFANVKRTIRRAHMSRTSYLASDITRYKKIGSLARELIKELKASNAKVSFPLASNDIMDAIEYVAQGAEGVGRLAKVETPGQWAIKVRKNFVEGLLNAAWRAGGRLTLNRRTEDGSLVDALGLLSPYLPQEGISRQSFSTLRRIYENARKTNPWLKNPDDSPKKVKN